MNMWLVVLLAIAASFIASGVSLVFWTLLLPIGSALFICAHLGTCALAGWRIGMKITPLLIDPA